MVHKYHTVKTCHERGYCAQLKIIHIPYPWPSQKINSNKRQNTLHFDLIDKHGILLGVRGSSRAW